MPDNLLTQVRIQSSWNFLLSLLPKDWSQKAYATEAFCQPKELQTPLDLLRLLLMHTAGCSLRETAVRAAAVGWRSVKPETLQAHLERAGDWLQDLTQSLVEPWKGEETLFKGREALLVDASALSRRGSRGTDYRLHYVMQLQGLRCRFHKLTGVKIGETFRLFDFPAGAIVIGDRLYSSPKGIAWVVQRQCDALVRVNAQNLRLFSALEGAPVDLRELGRGLLENEVRRATTWIRHGTQWIQGRVILKKLSAKDTEKARKRLRRRSSRRSEKLSPLSWELAGYLIVWTTLGEEWTDEEVLELYRCRWQIELLFKRLKSILGASELAKKKDETGQVWLQGKLLLALWLEALRRRGENNGKARKKSRRVRSHWRDTLWLWRDLQAVLIPPLDLEYTVAHWQDITEDLSESPRQRSCQSAELLQ